MNPDSLTPFAFKLLLLPAPIAAGTPRNSSMLLLVPGIRSSIVCMVPPKPLVFLQLHLLQELLRIGALFLLLLLLSFAFFRPACRAKEAARSGLLCSSLLFEQGLQRPETQTLNEHRTVHKPL